MIEEVLDHGCEQTLIITSWLVAFDVRQAEFDKDAADVLVLELDGPFGSTLKFRGQRLAVVGFLERLAQDSNLAHTDFGSIGVIRE